MCYFHNKINSLKGFSLIEVMVTMAVFAVLSVYTYSSYPRLNNVLGFHLSVQDVTGRLKSAQIKGSSSGGDYRGYGMYFRSDASGNYLTTSFYDKENPAMNALGVQETNRYFFIDPLDTESPLNDVIDTEEILRNNTIVSDLCVKPVSSNISCSKSSLSVTFVRPSTQANITDYAEDNIGNKVFYEIGYIELRTDKVDSGYYKCIQIYRNGQLSVISGRCNTN